MLDSMTLLWLCLGGLSLAFAFIQYAYSYRKRGKTEPTEYKREALPH